MKFNDIVRFSLNNLMHRGLRSWLTIFGIVIGVASVVAIISVGTGAQESISSQLGGLGANILSVSAGSSRAFGFGGPGGEGSNVNQKNLTLKDVQTIKTVQGVQYVDGIISGRISASYLAQNTTFSVQGADPLAWTQMTTTQLDSGRYLSPSDGNVVVIGYSIANNVFKQPLMVNTQLIIGGSVFKVVGILQQSGGFGGSDNTVVMPINAARNIIDSVLPNQFSSIQVQVSDPTLVNQTSTAIDQKLMIERHVNSNTKDYSITSSQSLQQTISTVTNTLSLFLAGIAAISLLVGAIGIANTMFMSVMERTKQIGVLKALGATNTEITEMFLTESSIMGLIGGLVGIFLGFIASGIVSEIGGRIIGTGTRGLSTSITVITPDLVIFSLVFSIIIGALSGLLPARRAAKLQPVEALRYE
ncbi:MAG: ABC transporter permease [Candidatus Bathyarchaeota archaeon]